MNRTQENITKYKKMLPGLKEKLIAAVLLAAMTAAMLVTSTFAWLTLSYNPAVQNVHTAVASNGNLEIALATGTTAPSVSAVGDGLLSTAQRNLTWGNLINLNDSSYGLKNLVLRPALLNESNLIGRPLYGPVYDKDGRVIGMNTNFGYSTWQGSQFEASDKLGVRAITSMKSGESSEKNDYNDLLINAEAKNAEFRSKYEALAMNEDYMNSLASMMAGYLVQNVFRANPDSNSYKITKDATLYNKDLDQFILMYKDLIGIFEDQAEVYANFLNLQAKVLEKNLQNPNLKITAQEILALSYDKTAKTAYNALKNKGFTVNATKGFIIDIDNFLADYAILKADLVRVQALEKQVSSSVSWPNSPKMADGTTRIIDDLIKNLVDIKKCKVVSKSGKSYTMGSIGASIALELKNDAPCEAIITNGILYNIDMRSGARLTNDRDKKALKLEVGTLIGTQSIEANVSTSADDNYFENERAALQAKILADFGAPVLVANNSYGFAVDFWVRTNAASSFLTLQGNVLSYIEEVPVTGKDINGNEVDIYTISVSVESEEGNTQGGLLDNLATVSYDVYESTYIPEGEQNEVKCLRFADNHDVVTKETLGGQDVPTTKTRKINEVEHIIGFEGDNRVWNGDQYIISSSSTTQGSGSCYTFYAETPVDQERSLNILNSMKVAFVDETGTLLTEAYMDTSRHYASSGKVTVPLVLKNTSINIGEDEDGNPKYAITALEQNVPKRITAIVYLDGTNLTNDDVLAAADIQGQMNIQFGSSAVLVPLNNEKLSTSEFYAEVQDIDPDTFYYDKLTEGEKMTSKVKVKITGTQPNQVTANFIRRINATQGSPEAEFTLTDTDGDGVWEGDYTFLYPGNYILRSIMVDGVERDLKIPEGQDFPTVVVNGFTISSVSYSIDEFVMSDADSHSGDISLQFATNNPDKMPKTVIGQFIGDNGSAVNVNFAYNATVGQGAGAWLGTANFVSSGEYTMQYVILDGQYVELPESMQKTVDLTLGMRVNVETTSNTQISYTDDTKNEKLALQVEVIDNSNNIVKNLPGVTLYYGTGTNQQAPVLKYNSNLGYYEGELAVEPGIWRFSHLNIKTGENSTSSLTRVNADAPVFTVIPPTPPSYVSNSTPKAVYIADGDSPAKFTVTLKDAVSATAYVKAVNQDGKILYIANNQDDEVSTVADTEENPPRTLSFSIAESGEWTVESISLFNVYDGNGKLYELPSEVNDDTYDEGFMFDADDNFASMNIAVLCEKDIDISYDFNNASSYVDDKSRVVIVGKSNDGTIGRSFMQAHTFANEAIKIKVTDDANLIEKGYFDISDLTLSYNYGSSADANGNLYGGYTNENYQNRLYDTKATKLTFNGSDDPTQFLLAGMDESLTYSARYVPEILTFKLIPKAATEVLIELEPTAAYSIDVYSQKPTVIFTATDPKVGEEFENANTSNVSNSISSDGLSATVYYKGNRGSFGCSGYSASSVTASLSGLGNNFTSATCTFVSKGKAANVVFTFKPNELQDTQKVGSDSSDNSKCLGTDVTCTEMVVEYNDEKYTISLTDAIKITHEK